MTADRTHPPRAKRRAAFALSLALALVATAPRAQENVTLNFVDADLGSVIRAVGEITGKNFILDPRVKGTINLVSSTPIPAAQTYDVLLAALRSQGFTAVESGGVVRIVPEAEAKQNASPTVTQNRPLSGNGIVTEVYALRHESAALLAPVLRPLITPNNTISVYSANNSVIITDYADNVRRLRKIIQAVDRPSQDEITVYALEHASAVDLAQTLVKLLPGTSPTPAAGQAQRVFIVPEVRTNSLLVRADSTSEVVRAGDLITRLDVPASASGSIHVVYLRNADATKIAETLRAMIAGEARAALPQAAAAATPGTPAASAERATPGLVQADAATNSLIIAGSDPVYNALRSVIEKLDTRRAQVYIEALIAEISTEKAAQFGLQFQDLSGVNSSNTRVIGGTNFSTTPGANIIGAATNLGGLGSGINIGVIKGTVTLPGINGEILNLGLLARALESNADANILSTPNLLTMDNEEARIVVGQNIPILTGSYAQSTGGTLPGAAVNPFQTIERQDIGLTLRVQPQVAEGNTVKLKIFQEVSSIQDATNAAGIITNKRAIESTVLVENNQIVVLGGLIQDDVKNNVDKVPLLGDLPVIGYFFRYENRRRAKTNLMVFLRPRILRDVETANALTGDRYDYIRGEQARFRVPEHFLLPDLPSPLAPAAEFPSLRLDGGLQPATVPPPEEQGAGDRAVE